MSMIVKRACVCALVPLFVAFLFLSYRLILARHELVEARMLLTESLDAFGLASLSIKNNDVEKANEIINDISISIVQYAVERNVKHAYLSESVRSWRDSDWLKGLGDEIMQDVFKYSELQPSFWDSIRNYRCLKWKSGRNYWDDWREIKKFQKD